MKDFEAFLKDVGKFLEEIAKGIAGFLSWVYNNILWLILATMLINIVIFLTLNGDIANGEGALRLWGLWNILVLICLAVRFINTPEFR